MEIEFDPEKAALNPINLRRNDMNANSDPMYEKYKDLDFEEGKPVDEIPALAQLQAEQAGKTRITMRVDSDILAIFKAKAETTGGNYQNMILNLQRHA